MARNVIAGTPLQSAACTVAATNTGRFVCRAGSFDIETVFLFSSDLYTTDEGMIVHHKISLTFTHTVKNNYSPRESLSPF